MLFWRVYIVMLYPLIGLTSLQVYNGILLFPGRQIFLESMMVLAFR